MGNSSRLRHLDALLVWALQSYQNLLDVFRLSSEPHRGHLGMTEVHVNGKKTIISQHFLDITYTKEAKCRTKELRIKGAKLSRENFRIVSETLREIQEDTGRDEDDTDRKWKYSQTIFNLSPKGVSIISETGLHHMRYDIPRRLVWSLKGQPVWMTCRR